MQFKGFSVHIHSYYSPTNLAFFIGIAKCLEDKYFSHILLRILETIHTFFQGDSQGGGVKGIPTVAVCTLMPTAAVGLN
jgi:hypothetical protein